MEEIYNELIKKISKERVLLNEKMSKHTSFKVGGPADIFIKVKTLEELKYVLSKLASKNIKKVIIGNGTNLLVKDGGIRGAVIKLDFKDIEFIDNTKIKVGSGVLLIKLANEAYKKGLSGLEFACGIPGTIGGAIRMNAGAYGYEIKDIIVSTTYLDEDLNLHTITNSENEFKYRNSRFSKNSQDIILEAVIELRLENKQKIKEKMDINSIQRKEKQPINFASAGSTFKRNDNFIVAKLIDQCNLKGYNVGDAYVSEKHAGFIVNKKNAKAKDILELIKIVKQKVKEKFDVDIELEIEVLGED